MNNEMNELVVANNELKNRLSDPQTSRHRELDEQYISGLKGELESERKSKLTSLAKYDQESGTT